MLTNIVKKNISIWIFQARYHRALAKTEGLREGGLPSSSSDAVKKTASKVTHLGNRDRGVPKLSGYGVKKIRILKKSQVPVDNVEEMWTLKKARSQLPAVNVNKPGILKKPQFQEAKKIGILKNSQSQIKKTKKQVQWNENLTKVKVFRRYSEETDIVNQLQQHVPPATTPDWHDGKEARERLQVLLTDRALKDYSQFHISPYKINCRDNPYPQSREWP